MRAEQTEIQFPERHFDFLDKYCLDCHDADTEKGKVNLEDISFDINSIKAAERWQKVLNSINSKEMPPEDKKQPEGEEKADFLADLADTMVLARKSLADSGGKITMRRLNRREYQNTIEHLLGVRVDASSLPTDGGGDTFDTEGASQFISSDQIEQYLKLGRGAIGELFERQAAAGQETKVFRVEPENTVNVESRKAMAVQEETYERYLKWKAEVDKVAFLPGERGSPRADPQEVRHRRPEGQPPALSKHQPPQGGPGCDEVRIQGRQPGLLFLPGWLWPHLRLQKAVPRVSQQ